MGLWSDWSAPQGFGVPAAGGQWSEWSAPATFTIAPPAAGAATRGLSTRIEVWDRRNARRLSILHAVTAAERTQAIGREETLSLTSEASDAGLDALTRGAVLRVQTLGEAADFTLWRVTRATLDRSSGQALQTLDCQALWMDLRMGRVGQAQADGSVQFVFGLVGLTPAEWLSTYILPAAAGDSLSFELGVVEVTDPIDLTLEQPATPLEGLRQLEQIARAEARFRYSADGQTCYVDLLERVGSAQGTARLRYGRNLLGLSRTDDDSDSISRIYASGSGLLTLADAVWRVSAVRGVAGARVVSFWKSPVFEDGAFVGLFLQTGGVCYPITGSEVASGTITVDDTALATPNSPEARLCTDAAGTRLAYLESPAAVAQIGVRTGDLADATDVPDARNLLTNPDFAQWDNDRPQDWTKLNFPALSQLSDPLYARHGSAAVRVEASMDGEGIAHIGFAVPAGATADARRPYLGISAGLTVLSGEVRLELLHDNGQTYPLQERPGPTGLNVYDVVRAGPVDSEPLPAGIAQLALVAHGGPATFVVDFAMATPQVAADVPGYVRDQGAWVLWDRAVDDLALRSVQAREYDVSLADLYRIDPSRFVFDALHLGDDVQVWDPAFGDAERLRIVELTTDLLHPEVRRLSVAPGPWSRPIRTDVDVFRPRYTPRRPSYGARVTRPRAQILSLTEQFDAASDQLFLSVLANSATATLQLFAKAAFADAYPAAPAQTIAGRTGTFALDAPDTQLYYRVVPLDGRGVAGDAQEGAFDNAEAIRTDLATLDEDVHGAYRDGVIDESEAKAIESDRKRLVADQTDLAKEFTALDGNTALTGSAKTDLEAAWGDAASGYTKAYDDLLAAIDALVAADADGVIRISAAERTAYESASGAYATALGALSAAVQGAIDAIKAAGVQEAKDYSDAQLAPVAQDASDAIAAAAAAQGTADGKVTTFFGPSAPVAEAVGDLWIDTDDGNHLYRWDGASWVGAKDAGIAQAISAAATAQTTADGKIVSFYQASPPTTDGVGDLWVDTDDGNRLYRWSGATWVDVRDSGIAQAISVASGAQTTANGKITTFFQTSAPTAKATGDLWVDTDDGNHLYRWSGSAWVSVQDQGIGDALANAATAQETADGKIVSFYQPSPPPASAIGDLWTDTDDSNRLYRWDGSQWVSVRDGGAEKADGALDDPNTLNEGVVVNLSGVGMLMPKGMLQSACSNQQTVDYGQSYGDTIPLFVFVNLPAPDERSVWCSTLAQANAVNGSGGTGTGTLPKPTGMRFSPIVVPNATNTTCKPTLVWAASGGSTARSTPFTGTTSLSGSVGATSGPALPASTDLPASGDLFSFPITIRAHAGPSGGGGSVGLSVDVDRGDGLGFVPAASFNQSFGGGSNQTISISPTINFVAHLEGASQRVQLRITSFNAPGLTLDGVDITGPLSWRQDNSPLYCSMTPEGQTVDFFLVAGVGAASPQ